MAANRKMVIKPVRHQVPLDSQYADSTWVSLKSAIEAIFAKNASTLSYATLYRCVPRPRRLSELNRSFPVLIDPSGTLSPFSGLFTTF